MSTHWKLTLAYDGTDFHGWQIQPTLPTLQGTLANVIFRLTGERVLPQGSGRTDAGVHALGQVASFSLHAPIPASNLLRALNRALPPTVRVLAAEPVSHDFHARYSSIGKTYQYRVFPAAVASALPRPSSSAICSPFLARTVHVYPWPLDFAAMQQAAQFVLGTHDFTSFAAVDPDLTTRNLTARNRITRNAATSSDAPSPLDHRRTLHQSHWAWDSLDDSPNPRTALTPEAPALFCYTVRGNGFLHHMVRNLVGTFLEVGRSYLSPDAIPAILAARDRSQAGPTAPACGLFLVKVEYR